MTINPALPSEAAWDGTAFQSLNAQGQYDPVATAAALAAYVAANPPPAPAAPPSQPSAPVPVFISKVDFERRFLPAEFARMDALKTQIDQRPANWPTLMAAGTAPWNTLGPLVEGVVEYEDASPADGLNVNDAQFQAFVGQFPALGIIAYSDYVPPAPGAVDAFGNPIPTLTSTQWSAQRIAALLAP